MAEIQKMATGTSGTGGIQEVAVRIINQMVFVRNDTPVVDTSVDAQTFLTSYEYVPGTLVVTLNGLRQREGQDYDYVESGTNQFHFNTPLVQDDSIICDYIKIQN